MSVWQGFEIPGAGLVNLFSEAIDAAEEIIPDLLVPVDEGLQIIASDYSGQHRGAMHDVYSFVITTEDSLEAWLPLHEEFRAKWLPDGRRLSFKQLREPLRRRAYPVYLELCGALSANVITVMIDNRVGSFARGGPLALARALDDCFMPNATPASIERAYRLAMCIAMVQAGLRREDQPSLWISDHDETLDSFEKRERFARLASYLTFGLTGRRNSAGQHFLTTEDGALPYWGEDLAAIPDIAAGACARLDNKMPLFLYQRNWAVGMSYGDDIDWRAKIFADWLGSPRGALRHVLLRMAPDLKGDIRASAQQPIKRR